MNNFILILSANLISFIVGVFVGKYLTENNPTLLNSITTFPSKVKTSVIKLWTGVVSFYNRVFNKGQ